MSSTRNNKLDLSGYDWIGIGLCFLIIAVGWVMIYASEYNPESYNGLFDLKKNYGKQLLWIGVGLSLGLIIQFINGNFYQTFAFIFFGAACFLLILVLFTKPIHGATSWFDIGGFRFQPSEFAKTATNLALAALLTLPSTRVQDLSGRLQAIGLLAIPILLVLLQGDAGSTLVYTSFIIVLFRAGISPWYFIIGGIIATLSILSLLFDEIWGIALILLITGAAILLRIWKKDDRLLAIFIAITLLFLYFRNSIPINYLLVFYALVVAVLSVLNIIKRQFQATSFTVGGIVIAILYTSSVNFIVNQVLQPHQQERIWVWLRPEKCDPLGSLYNLEQSKFAIGSGGWSGKGFLEGERTKLDYVPEQSTDFIFCTIGEEWGFVGSTILIGLFVALLLRILHIAERQRSSFSKFYTYGVSSILLFHIFVNVGMTMGLLPVIGIPLPFISYGGSSLISFAILISIMFKLDADRMNVFR